MAYKSVRETMSSAPLPTAQVPVSVRLTKKEAEDAFNAIQGAMMDCVSHVKKAQRARTWGEALKSARIQHYREQHAALDKLREKIGEAFNIGGY